ncbi:ABC transporter substrate-binding protein [Aeromonas simiae]|uniref:Iron-siderophore ABC transporter substrate-binding protein n=1 Tax=Aeromonas simiae TaxID=218936 RepID=A0A5J6WXP2_9GAMM|nr:iron-siderophore ABC transporter substrate-binding protein [Aeromonas simiae]QFI54523.1 iron-siderophore ABC transporter substrate-binding protein [Aeromonas simiae]
MSAMIRIPLLLLLLASSALQAATREITDAIGRVITVPARPERVVTLGELELDSVLTLGVQPVGTLNGRGQSTLPHYLLPLADETVRIVGDLGAPNLEALIDLEPDLILTGQVKPELLALLQAIAPTVVTSQFNDAWKPVFTRIATVLGKPAQASAFMANYQQRLDAARQAIAPHQGETISIVRWNPKGPSFMYSGTFASTVVAELGLRRPANQMGERQPHSPALSLESLGQLDANWLVIGTLSPSGEAVDAMRQAEQSPAFAQLPVIKAGRYRAVDGSLWTSTGGPQAALRVIDDVVVLLQGKPE